MFISEGKDYYINNVKTKSNVSTRKKRNSNMSREHTQRTTPTGETITITKSYGGRGCKQATTEQACAALLRTKGNISAAARLLGLTRAAFDNEYVKKIPEVMEAKNQARQIILDVTEDILEKRIRKADPWAVCFTLKTIGKDRGYIEKMEIGGRLEGLTIAVAGLPKDISGADL